MPPNIDPNEAPTVPSRILLIGYRGCGKTTIGKILGQRTGWPVVDTDACVQTTSGMSITQIFSEHGEDEFRRLETQALADAINQHPHAVISLGGGAPTIAANRPLLDSGGLVIWLRGSAETLWQRISSDHNTLSQRPDLTQWGGRMEVEEVLSLRSPIYEAVANKIVDVDRRTPNEIADLILTP